MENDVMGGLVAAVGAMWFVTLIIGIVSLIAWAQILKKAGKSPWMCLLWLVPIVGIVYYFIFAFSEWPVVQELKALKGQNPQASTYGKPMAQ